MLNPNAIEATSVADVFRDASDGIFIIDRHRKVTLFSPGCERITGLSAFAAVGVVCSCHEITDCKDEYGRPLDGVLCPAVQVLEGTVPNARQRMSVAHPTGRRTWVETSYSPLKDDIGAIIGVIAVMRDISNLVEREAEHATVGGLPNAIASETPLTSPMPSMGPLDQRLTTIERREILAALERASGQRTLAARNLGISRSRLYRRMEALGIDREGSPISSSASRGLQTELSLDR